ncbi:hypothetical protein B0F90DRAFT_1642085 [Multifurca ochricompacta]|uniref:Uncharacterized protein n=1 Tax=Multifurca ochricompacta TaxID=376703 RepID=A0AAD4QJG3_9AGAM|nr:hypothetical protein B0F90DRAFT_1648368 [Multifurca ochricompacta]KAI0293880.1 hypothetical protein B0F90DRAFT_1642085 [Multifurca ochricompacta]
MANIGSVFLGDVQRNRLRSSASTPGSTPPSSPPPSLSTSHGASSTMADPMTQEKEMPTSRPHLSPTQSLELRVRWLEALLYGPKHEPKPEMKHGETLTRAAELAYRRMDDLANTHNVLRKFLSHYEQHAQYLNPAFALSGTLPVIAPPDYAEMAPAELAALATELEPDICAADNDMREINALQQKGVTGAGKLSDYEALQPRLEALLLRHAEDLERATALEKRVARIVRQYALQTDSLSELFVAWDETLRAAEDKVGKMEKVQEERSRHGYE